MVHAYSLIHDDLPCMDDDDMRRGRPSCHKAHGEAVALLAGDALSAYAGKYICDSDLSVEKKTAMIKELYDRTLGMIEGQTIDTDGKVVYTELVPEIAQEPDYNSAINSIV